MQNLITSPENENWYEYLLKKKNRTFIENVLFYAISIIALFYMGVIILCIVIYFIILIPFSLGIIVIDKIKEIIKDVNKVR